MSETNLTLDSAKKRYFLSEASEDLNRALRKGDYNAAKEYAESMYKVLFELCENQTGKEKEAEKSRLRELSDIIDNLNERLTSGEISQ